jgi:hypothetical protein
MVALVKAIEAAPIETSLKKSLPNPTLLRRADIQFLCSSSENTLKKLMFVAIAVVFCLLAASAFGQGFDAAFGISSISSSTASTGTCPSGTCIFPSERGGVYPGFSADLLIHHRIGFEGELFWKASQGLYGSQLPYRPIFYNFNAMWAPRISKNFTGEVLGGIGGEDLRFYGVLNFNPLLGYTNYTSSNHFMGDVGAGLRAYFWHDAFLRPEVRLYLINNNVEFSSGRILRYGVSLGYSFGGR